MNKKIEVLWKKHYEGQNHAQEHQVTERMYGHQLITINDLAEFKKELIEELLLALRSQTAPSAKKWMKSHEVRKLLKISAGTLQTLKSSGVIPYTKIGGVHFYDYEDIQDILESGKINTR